MARVSKVIIQPRQAGKSTLAKAVTRVSLVIAATKDDDTNGAGEAINAIMRSIEPWEQCPDVWKTKAAFFQWMRGQMRKAWSRHPVKVSYMHNHRQRVPLGRVTEKNPKGLVWGCECEHCHQLFKQPDCEVDHIEAAGSFKGWEDFEAWMMKLMHINWNSIRVVCKECHRIISYAERMKLTFSEARIAKQAIAFSKKSVAYQTSTLKCAGIYDTTNAKQRRAAYHHYLLEQACQQKKK